MRFHQLLQMIGQAQSQGNDRQGRIRETSGGKNRTARHVKVRNTVHPGIRIHHPLPGINMHPGGAHLMMRTCKRRPLTAVQLMLPDEHA